MNLATPVTVKVAAFAGAACLVVGLACGAAIGNWLRGLQADADIAQLKADHKEAEKQWLVDRNAITTKAQQDTAAALERERQARDAAADLDTKYQELLANEKLKNDALRGDIASGQRRVRILEANLATANLAARQHATGGSAGAGSVGDGKGAELTAEGGLLVLDIRDGIKRREDKIEYLQSYITDVVKQCKR